MMTSIQRRLKAEYERRGYYQHLKAVPQSRGEILMRRDISATEGVLQIIHKDGHTVTRSLRGTP